MTRVLLDDDRPPLDPVGLNPPFPIEFPVHVLSDMHFGHPASFLLHPEMVLPLVEGAATVVFNGDSFEQRNIHHRRDARRKLGRLMEVLLARGVVPRFLAGNHDPMASSLHHLDLLDGNVFLTHGDILHPDVAPWSHHAPSIRRERLRLAAAEPPAVDVDAFHQQNKKASLVSAIYTGHAREGFLGRMEMVGEFALAPWRILKAVRYWSRVARFSSNIRKRFRPNCKLMIIGHTHRPGVWTNSDYTLVNTGSFQPLSRPLVVRIETHRAVVFNGVRRRDRYELGRERHTIHWNDPSASR
ncbi:MAG: metallophosphoesterase [Planctomycetia bacterium]